MTGLFLKIVNMSISASWLVLAVLLLRLALKKAPRWVSVLLWGIVAIRLVCPFSIQSPLSLIPSAETISPAIMLADTPALQTGVSAINSMVNPVIGSSLSPAPGASMNPLQLWIPLLTAIWLIGMAALIEYAAVSYWRLCKRVATAVIYQAGVYQSEGVCSPFILGIIRPRIYLPFKMEGQDMGHVIAHEQAHIRRRDHWWKPLGFLLLAIHWFNPLMWLAYVLLCRDIELACDERVIKDLGSDQRADYTQALLACSVKRPMITACPLAFGEVGIKERVKSVMNYKKPAFWIIALAILVCVAVGVCFLTNPLGDKLTELTIDEVDMGALLEDVRSMDIQCYGDTISCTDGYINRFIATMDKIRVNPSPVSQDRSEERDKSFVMIINGKTKLNFAGDFSSVWIDNGVKLSLSYPIANPETAEELRLDFSFAGIAPAAEPWFDYLADPSKMTEGLTAELSVFPGVTFRYTGTQIIASKAFDDSGQTGHTILIDGMPIWNAYFADMTGDGLPDICATYTWGSGIIDSRIVICDYANGASYELSDRGRYDFSLWLNKDDCCLYVDKADYNTGEMVDFGRLGFEDDCIKAEWSAHHSLRAAILEIGEGYFLVEPVKGSSDPGMAEQIRVPMENMSPSPEPQAGDVIEIVYDGVITGSDPAQIAKVYSISVAKKAEEASSMFEVFNSSVAADGTAVITDHVYAEDGAYGLEGVIQYTDETQSPWKLAFIRDGAAHTVSQLWGEGYSIASRLHYDGNGVVRVYVQHDVDGTLYECTMAFSYDENEHTSFKAGSREVEKTEEPGERYYLTIGADGVKSIEVTMPRSSGGCINADESPFKKGERLWLENLDGYSDLRGLTIAALGEDGETIWSASVPDTEENAGLTRLTVDGWTITNIP